MEFIKTLFYDPTAHTIVVILLEAFMLYGVYRALKIGILSLGDCIESISNAADNFEKRFLSKTKRDNRTAMLVFLSANLMLSTCVTAAIIFTGIIFVNGVLTLIATTLAMSIPGAGIAFAVYHTVNKQINDVLSDCNVIDNAFRLGSEEPESEKSWPSWLYGGEKDGSEKDV